MESSAASTSRLSIRQRISLKRTQVLAEMSEMMHTLSSIEAVLDEINRSIRPIDTDSRYINESTPSSADYPSKSSSNDTALSASQNMQQLMIELEKWEEM
jgi:hypothetical protein